jgi:hypothetical protein|tara:strand:+ start:90 stop:428 length:339 start_codon:yes stop_codon:yes gene_type:complete
MIDETMRAMSHRESVQDYTNYVNKRKSQIAHEKKIEFEESLKASAVREKISNTGLFGANNSNLLNRKVGGAYQKIKNRTELENIMIQRFTNTIKAYSNDEILDFARDTANEK